MRNYILIFLLMGFAAWADEPNLQTQVAEALDSENYAELETLFSEADETARSTTDFAPLYNAFRLFTLASKDRFAKIRAWQHEYPDSIYAATALANMHFTQAFLYRGTNYARFTSREAFSAYSNEVEAADRLTRLARTKDPDFVPALRMAIQLAGVNVSGDRRALINRLIELAPDRHSMSVAIGAMRTVWGGSISENITLCTAFAARVPDHDAELCMIRVALTNNAEGLLKTAALAAMARRDDEILDYWRLQTYLNEWRHKPEAIDEVKRIQRARLNWIGFDGQDFIVINHTLSRMYDEPFFAAEMTEAGLAEMAARLENEPQNYVMAGDYVYYSYEETRRKWGEVQPEQIGEMLALWPGVLDLGRFNPGAWKTGWRLMLYRSGRYEFEALAPFTSNMIYYSNHNPSYIHNYLGHVYELWESVKNGPVEGLQEDRRVELKSETECELVRASRILEAICTAEPNLTGCNIGGWGGLFPEEVRRMSKRAKQCWQTHAELDHLLYRPVEVSPDIFAEGAAE